jgi:VanZ family protein
VTGLLARNAWWWRAAAPAWMVLMFWLSSRSDFPEPSLLPEWLPIDKLAHLLLFAVLAALLYLAGLRAPLAVLGAALYGMTDEVHQMFVPGRSPDVRDWLADTLGAVLGVWAAQTWETARRRRAQAVRMSRDQRDA